MSQQISWSQFQSRFFFDRQTRFSLDLSRIALSDQFLMEMKPKVDIALQRMVELEQGAIANPDEKRMVGHYWLREPKLAPSTEIRSQIEAALSGMKTFADAIHVGTLKPEKADKFDTLLLVGIGGSALGPQFVTQALGSVKDPLRIVFFDNTDPDGMDRTLAEVEDIGRALTIVISKSGGTKETRNGQLVAKAAYEAAGLNFAKHFVAVTSEGSELDKIARSESWIARFPMWDWVGGRTSELSAVGLLPAALQGYRIDEMLAGARAMDELTRRPDMSANPAVMMALAWYRAGSGRGAKDMVILPYKDRLELFSRYLQQLVMESLGKEHDLDGKVVNQGIAVYGNKGSTDQHAYVQQLRDGVNNFFVVFIEVLKSRSNNTKPGSLPPSFSAAKLQVEQGITCADYLAGFFQGTRSALYEKGRESLTISVNEVKEFEVGMLIALFERAVGLYATLVNINAYHQPGVEAGKKAAGEVLKLQTALVHLLSEDRAPQTAEQIAGKLGKAAETEEIFRIARRLAADGRLKVLEGASVFEDRYSLS